VFSMWRERIRLRKWRSHNGRSVSRKAGGTTRSTSRSQQFISCPGEAGGKKRPRALRGFSSFEEFAASRSPARAVANVENPNGGGLDGEVNPVDVRIPKSSGQGAGQRPPHGRQRYQENARRRMPASASRSGSASSPRRRTISFFANTVSL
jgi:hypothetical protein